MAETINVIWKSYHEPEAISRGYWDQGIIEDTLKDPKFVHRDSFTTANGDGAIVVINGRMHDKDVDRINKHLALLPWVILIITGDEEALFPWQEIRHPMIRTWVQLPRMNVHNDVSLKLVNGYRPNTPQVLKEIGQQERRFDFSFVGQMNHPRREQCVEAAREVGKDRPHHILTTMNFGHQLLSQPDYLNVMAQSKIVLCPSGIETPDTFRLYEALEAGCLPIVDAFATNNQSYGFWKYLFDEDVPFPIVDYWDKLPALLPELLRDWPRNANRAAAWWQQKKRTMNFKLEDQIKELSR